MSIDFGKIFGGKDDDGEIWDGEWPKFPESSSIEKLNKSIVFSGSKDFQGRGYRASDSNLGDGSQKEGQKPLFIVKGGEIKNVVIYDSGADGIHFQGGSCKGRNLTYQDIGEDAFTQKCSHLFLEDIYGQHGADKFGQLNGPNSKGSFEFEINNFFIQDVGRGFRLNGGNNAKPHKAKIILRNGVIRDADQLIRNTLMDVDLYAENIDIVGVKKGFDMRSSDKVKLKNIRYYKS